MKRLPVLSIPHGGGPWPWMKNEMGDPQAFQELEDYLTALGKEMAPRVSSLLVISAHWEESLPTVHFGPQPGMLYDYGGFPDFAYRLSWPAPGNPVLAARVKELLGSRGIESGREENRGYDHGTFVPLMLMFPEARIPTAQLSLVRSLDPQTHLEIGRALEPLREEGVLILASGMSYHNMRGFFSGDPAVREKSSRFDEWLQQTVALPAEERYKRLHDWNSAPEALHCHPRSEHLIPLLVAAGAAGEDPGRVDYSGFLMNTRVSAHRFGT